MRTWLLTLVMLLPSVLYAQKEDLIKYLDAYKTFEFSESKEVIKKYTLDSSNSVYNIISYEEPNGILFEADTLDIHGYKALVNCKVKNNRGQYVDAKMIVIMYPTQDKIWRVGLFREALDPLHEYETAKQRVISGNFYTKKQYVYRNLSYRALYAGKIKEAIKWIKEAEKEAELVNDSEFDISEQKYIISQIQKI